MSHIVLLGDSIFDNAAYTHGQPAVISQLREIVPAGWSASLLALDGTTIESLSQQLGRIPDDASHLVLSVGGNDALRNASILLAPARAVADALTLLADAAAHFERKYRDVVSECKSFGLPLTICTIYNGSFPDLHYQRLASTALTVFNDAILRSGFEFGLGIIDLRLVCSSPVDYANPIEPSSAGGAKIARAVIRSVLNQGTCARVIAGQL